MESQMVRLESWRLRAGHARRLRSVRLAVVLLTPLVMIGCAQMNNLKARLTGRQTTQAPAAATATPASATPGAPRFSVIVNGELQHGHYAEGEKALRQYLAQHPGDRPAQFMLQQLTADPKQMLGHASRPYVVQAGDSFSALAARYLGDSDLFLILARYNGSTNPSQLSVGETIRLPTAAPGIALPASAAASGANGTNQPAGASTVTPPPGTRSSSVDGVAAAKAARLQAESVAMFDHGFKTQALARLDTALDIDPHLPASGAKAAALRQELLGNYHQRAVVLYRDQHLNQAIALWNHVLTIDPGYEPAAIYRARALELKQRLKQIPAGH